MNLGTLETPLNQCISPRWSTLDFLFLEMILQLFKLLSDGVGLQDKHGFT